MLRYLFPSFLFAAVAISCGGTTAHSVEDPASDDVTSEAYKTKVGGVCQADSECSRTAFCDDLGYGPSRCRAKAASGAYCSDARQCKAGACTDYRCGAAACAKTGAGCKADTDCCAGSCTWDSYGPTPRHCSAPRENGSYCATDRGCVSGHCDQYQCKASAASCGAAGALCKATVDCCGNAFCDTDTYGPLKCTAPRAAGAYCNDAAECLSGSCVSYVCK